MTDRQISWKACQDRLVEHLGDQSKILVHGDVLTIADRDPGTLLATMLEREEPEIGEPCGLDIRSGYAEHPAGFAWSIRGVGDPEGLVVHGAQCTRAKDRWVR